MLRENLQENCRAPGMRQPLCASLRNRHGHGHLTRAILRENLQECRSPSATTTLCEPAQSKCTWTSHKRHVKRKNLQEKCRVPRGRQPLCTSHILQEFTRKMLHPKTCGETRAADFARSRNAHGDLTRALLCENLQNINAVDQGANPDLTPAFTRAVRTPQCGHMFGEKIHRQDAPNSVGG